MNTDLKDTLGAYGILVLGILFLTYLSMSFVLWELNPQNWGGNARLGGIVVVALCSWWASDLAE